MTDKPYKDYTAEDFAGITDLKERMTAFVLSTRDFYNLGNRSVIENSNICLYKASEKSPGCAIGRFVTVPLKERQGIGGSDIFPSLPTWMQEMKVQFLSAVQILHDMSENWTNTGISPRGAMKVNLILQMIQTLP